MYTFVQVPDTNVLLSCVGQDLVVAKPRDVSDHVSWAVQNGDLEVRELVVVVWRHIISSSLWHLEQEAVRIVDEHAGAVGSEKLEALVRLPQHFLRDARPCLTMMCVLYLVCRSRSWWSSSWPTTPCERSRCSPSFSVLRKSAGSIGLTTSSLIATTPVRAAAVARAEGCMVCLTYHCYAAPAKEAMAEIIPTSRPRLPRRMCVGKLTVCAPLASYLTCPTVAHRVCRYGDVLQFHLRRSPAEFLKTLQRWIGLASSTPSMAVKASQLFFDVTPLIAVVQVGCLPSLSPPVAPHESRELRLTCDYLWPPRCTRRSYVVVRMAFRRVGTPLSTTGTNAACSTP